MTAIESLMINADAVAVSQQYTDAQARELLAAMARKQSEMTDCDKELITQFQARIAERLPAPTKAQLRTEADEMAVQRPDKISTIAADMLASLDEFIAWCTATSEKQWTCDVVRSADGTSNCLFGHLFDWAEAIGQHKHGMDAERTQTLANHIWERFEAQYASTYKVYPVNDGQNPDYPQDTPRQRCIALLEDMNNDGWVDSITSMDREGTTYDTIDILRHRVDAQD